MTTRQTIAPIRKWHEYTDDEFALFDALDALTTYAQARRAWERADTGDDFETFSHAESVMRKCSSVLIEIERERNRLRAELAATPRWVSVTERLPKDYRERPVRTKDGKDYIAHYESAGWRCISGQRDVSWLLCEAGLNPVTHWLELPPAPGTEA